METFGPICLIKDLARVCVPCTRGAHSSVDILTFTGGYAIISNR